MANLEDLTDPASRCFIFHRQTKETVGPITVAVVREWIAENRVQEGDFVCAWGGKGWIPIMESQLRDYVLGLAPDDGVQAILHHMEQAEKEQGLLRLNAAYRNVFALLNDRSITQTLNYTNLMEAIDPPEPRFHRFHDTLKILPAAESSLADMERLWNGLRAINMPLAFDLVSKPQNMYFRVSVPEGALPYVEDQVLIHFPDALATVERYPEELAGTPHTCTAFVPADGTQFLDSSAVARDPYAQLFSILDHPAINEELVIQVICCPLPDNAVLELCKILNWKEPGISLAALAPGFEPLSAWAAELYWNIITDQSLAHRNLARVDIERFMGSSHLRLAPWPSPLYPELVTHRPDGHISYKWLEGVAGNIYHSHYQDAYPLAEHITAEIARAKQLYADSLEMKSRLERKQPAWVASVNVLCNDLHIVDMLEQRYFHQYETSSQDWRRVQSDYKAEALDHRVVSWNMVSTAELAGMAHFPTKGVVSPRLEIMNMKQKLPPEAFTSGGVVIGESEARGITKQVALPHSVRDRHVYIVGKSGTGKSTLIFNAALQDILNGEGVAVIDPHGDLIASGEGALLHHIPESRIQDVIYLNAADKNHPISMNLLKVSNEEELDLLATNLQTTFRRLSDSWGERMDNVLRFALHTLVQTPGTTFFDLKRLLQNQEYRKGVVSKLTDPRLIDFWQNDFASSRESVQPIINRMGKFMLSALYGMLSQPESNLNFYEVIQQRKILLVNLGGIGEDDAQLLGSLLVSQLQLAVMQRSKLPPDQRHPYYLYVDEFQNFTSRAFAKILSEARKYKLCLTLGHQFISQLGEVERDSIFGNIGTMIMFGVGDKDAQALRHQLGKFEPVDLANLPKYHALCRPEQANDTFLFKTNAAPNPQQSFADRIIEHTRATYTGKMTAPKPTEPASADAVKPPSVPPISAGDLKVSIAPPKMSLTKAEPIAVPTASELVAEESQPIATVLPAEDKPLSPRPMLTMSSLGRGGQQHKYLQQLIQRLAQDKGYRVTIEEPVLSGIGSVDVSLGRDGRRIACEISVSSTCEYEFKNVQKCLAAGFDQVIVLSSERKNLGKIKQLVTTQLDPGSNQKVQFLLPEDFVAFLEQGEAQRTTTEQTVRGYKVNVKYKAAGSGDQSTQRQAIAQVILQALKRLKDER